MDLARIENMLFELETNYLEVVLIPAPDQRHSTHSVRAVSYQNADWYKKFCLLYPSSSTKRTQRKSWTKIKRQATINALYKILGGDTSSVYAQRILQFIEQEQSERKTVSEVENFDWLLEKEFVY